MARVGWPGWDLRFMKLARHVSEWSKDLSTRVGAVIVDDERRVISLGYNGFPRGVEDREDRLQDRGQKLLMTVHAEANAILNATGPVRGATLYCTLCTCNECAKLLIQSGIETVVVPRLTGTDAEQRWGDSWATAREMYREAGVNIRLLDA